MGRVRRSRTHSGPKHQGKVRKQKRYTRELDQIAYDLQDPNRREKIEGEPVLPEDTPGFGAYPCIACDRHFISVEALQGHQRTKPHKKRLKQLKEKPFTQEEADLGAGRGVDRRRARSAADQMQVEG